MSSTNRSNERHKHISDYYVTPVDNIYEFLNEFKEHEDILLREIAILDPCAGGDEINDMSYPIALKSFNDKLSIDTIDIREDSKANIIGSYLDIDVKDNYDVIITNPPFNISLDIINKALDDVKDGGFVIMLLRLNYFGGKVRRNLWENNMPKYCFVHNKRIGFLGNGKKDSIEYCHMVWQKGYNEKFTKLMVLMED